MAASTTTIPGLDAILSGGFPTGRTTLVCGAPGTGKTVLALQYLIAGASSCDEPGLLVSFEESPAALRANVRNMTFSLESVLDKGVYIVDGRLPSEAVETGSFDLGGLIAVVNGLTEKHGIKRVAIDGIDALFSLRRNETNRRREILRVLHWLAESGLTAILTMKSDEASDGVPSHFAFTDFAADGVVQLRATMIGGLLRRTLRVVKLRGAGFVAGDHPYTISGAGIRVMTSPTKTSPSARTGAPERRLSTGIERLDRMLDGGYRVGTTTLISGLPGTAKTTLAANFLWAGCLAGERCLFIGFDEPAEQMLYDMQSIGIDLQTYLTPGLLHAQSYSAGTAIGDEHYLAIEALVDSHRPMRVVIDPVTALVKSGGMAIADIVTERLIALFKSRGITAVVTAVSDTKEGELESTTTRVSTVADTWIHLSFAAHVGERNRTLTLIKARGTPHSNQMREILISSEGVTLADIYASGGNVLLGTARLRHEQEASIDRELDEQRGELELRTLDEERETLTQTLVDVQHRLAQIGLHRTEIVSRSALTGGIRIADAAAVRASRGEHPDENERPESPAPSS